MYRKTHPQTFLISIWVCICLVSPFIKSDLLTPAIIFLIFGLIGLYFNLFVDTSIQSINRDNNYLHIKYKKGFKKQEFRLKNKDIQNLLFEFYVKSNSNNKGGRYNYIGLDITITQNNGKEIKLHDDYILNGFVWNVGKNIKQINSIKTLVNMFNNNEHFSYNIKKVHAIYDKRYEPEVIKLYINQ